MNARKVRKRASRSLSMISSRNHDATPAHCRTATSPMTATILVLCTGNATVGDRRCCAACPRARPRGPDGWDDVDRRPADELAHARRVRVRRPPTPPHRSRQVVADDLERATLVIALAPEHAEWVRRTHPEAASRTVTLRRLVRDLADDERPLANAEALRPADVELACARRSSTRAVVRSRPSRHARRRSATSSRRSPLPPTLIVLSCGIASQRTIRTDRMGS